MVHDLIAIRIITVMLDAIPQVLTNLQHIFDFPALIGHFHPNHQKVEVLIHLIRLQLWSILTIFNSPNNVLIAIDESTCFFLLLDDLTIELDFLILLDPHFSFD